ncbi:hypothetical protein KUTeg_010310 [Tegillarca granosa]|nr:hypothetical protein KUTeg_010310 [Tegillarca granosa]
MGKEKAILEIVMHTSTENGEYDTKVEELVGHFTTAGPMESAEGNVLQCVELLLNFFNKDFCYFKKKNK